MLEARNRRVPNERDFVESDALSSFRTLHNRC